MVRGAAEAAAAAGRTKGGGEVEEDQRGWLKQGQKQKTVNKARRAMARRDG